MLTMERASNVAASAARLLPGHFTASRPLFWLYPNANGVSYVPVFHGRVWTQIRADSGHVDAYPTFSPRSASCIRGLISALASSIRGGSRCPNWARSVLCGGRSAMSVIYRDLTNVASKIGL